MMTLSFQFTILEDKSNFMLNRRELKIFLKSAAGKISKIELVKMIAKNFKEDEKKIFPISLAGEKGKTDLTATLFIYENGEIAKKHLPKYRILRKLSKEDRKKIIDEEKAVKLKAKQAAKAEIK
jgi:small subunit ribosomal protein S24e